MKRRLFIILSLMLVFIMSFSAVTFAGTGYLSLGADLTEEETATVLELLGVDNAEDYDVLYITNADEHKYLDGYVDAAQIGNVSLSSVYLKEKKIGKGVDITLHNIGYCTEDMYKSALATAGVSGVDVVIAGPYEISGTAALVGTIKLFEQATGEEISDELIDAAVEELTTTGDLKDELGDESVAEEIIAYVKDKMADNPDMSDSELEQLIREAAEKAGKSLTENQIQKIKKMLGKLKGVDVDWGKVKEQSSEFIGNIVDAFDKEDAEKEAKGLIARFIEWIKSKF